MTLPRVAVIGAGAWGINHVRVLAASSRCVLAGIADVDPSSLSRAGALSPWARTTTRPRDVIDDPSIGAIVIASPAPTHADLAIAALAANKHVLVEKPFALDIETAHAIRTAAARRERVVMVGHLMVFHPAVVRLREMLASGELGTLHYLHSSRANLGRLRDDESALWSFGPHDLSMLDFLLERSPVTVSARGQCVTQPGIEDVVFLSLRYSSGEIAQIHLSRIHPRKERRLTLVCSQRVVEFDDVAPEKLRVYDKGFDHPPEFTQFSEYLTIRGGDVRIPQISMQEPLTLELEHFIDCIATNAKPRADLASAIRITTILAAAQRSLQRDGAPEELRSLSTLNLEASVG